MVQMIEAARILREWKKRGSPPCDHPRLEKEYHLGSDTGDKVCMECGGSFPWL
jgi:hypothetical protein